MTAIYAHRGHHADYGENTVDAVRAARQIGVDGVEIDVWCTHDERLVVHHNSTFEGRAVRSLSRADVRRLPELSEVLAVAGDVWVNIEVKSTRSGNYNDRAADALSRFLDATPPARCLVSSFSLAICERVRRSSTSRRVGWIVARGRAPGVVEQVVRSDLTSAHLAFAKVTPAVATGAAQRGIELHVWTPNLRRDIHRMLDLGVDALITDDVPLALKLRAEHAGSTHR